MRLFLYLILSIFLVLGTIYLVTQAFPGLFGVSFLIEQGAVQIDKNSIDTSQTAEEYIMQICGENCVMCNQSMNKCTNLLVNQVENLCDRGSQQEETCFYDLETLMAACKKICTT